MVQTQHVHPSPAVQAEHDELVALARRIIQRWIEGRHDMVAELLVRALATGRPEQTLGLALALTQEALSAAEDSRLDAATTGVRWIPAVYDSGELITPEDTSSRGIALAMRMLDAAHRQQNGDPAARAEVGRIFQTVLHDRQRRNDFFIALLRYAVDSQNQTLSIRRCSATQDIR